MVDIGGAASGAAAGGMAGGPWGALIGGGLSFLGGLGKGPEEKLYEQATKARRAGLPLYGFGDYNQFGQMMHDIGAGTFDPNNPAYGDNPFIDIAKRGGIGGIRKDYGEQFIQNINEGYKGATQSVHGQGRLARQGIAEERTKGMADVGQSMQDAGLVSSNIAQQAKANVGYQTSKALSGLNTEIAGMLSQLKLGKSQAMDAALARNLSMEERTNAELMSFLTGGAGYGPGAGLGSAGIPGSPDWSAVGKGATGIFDSLFGKGGIFAAKELPY